jgi:hypothetical protein
MTRASRIVIARRISRPIVALQSQTVMVPGIAASYQRRPRFLADRVGQTRSLKHSPCPRTGARQHPFSPAIRGRNLRWDACEFWSPKTMLSISCLPVTTPRKGDPLTTWSPHWTGWNHMLCVRAKERVLCEALLAAGRRPVWRAADGRFPRRRACSARKLHCHEVRSGELRIARRRP